MQCVSLRNALQQRRCLACSSPARRTVGPRRRAAAAPPAAAPLLPAAQLVGPAVSDVAEGLEGPVQILYLGILLALLAGGAWAVVRQLLTQREMDERSKVLGELIRTGDAVSEDYYALGVVLTRKKLFTQALKNYVKAIKLWEGDRSDLAEVHNAMGFCYQNMMKPNDAIEQYQKATKLQPGYVIGWNNLADALEREKRWKEALPAYEAAFELDPENETAQAAVERLRTKYERVTTPSSSPSKNM